MDGAIHRAAGSQLAEAARKFAPLPTGQACITAGYRLPAKHVIHTVGPVFPRDPEHAPELLASSYRSSLKLAIANGVRTIAFPAISCGAYGYPIDEAAKIAVREVSAFSDQFDRIILVAFDGAVYDALERSLRASQ